MAVNWGMYVHVPLCVKKCEYCDFCSVSSSRNLEKEVPLRLLFELNGAIEKRLSDDDRISSVFIGGGTPSVIPAKDIAPLLENIMKRVDSINHPPVDEPNDESDADTPCEEICVEEPEADEIEWTIECNPGTVDYQKLALYRQYGINRLSIGCQSVHDDELQALGRIHTVNDFFRTYDLARVCGFDNINVDLMYAVPDQSLKSYEQTLNRIIKLNPEHISAYSLIIEPGTPFYDKYAGNSSVDEETDRQMYEMTCELLETAGYVHYEISNFAKQRLNNGLELLGNSNNNTTNNADYRIEKETYACLHNLNYWRRGSYIGAGPSAASFYRNIGDYGTRTKRETDISRWIPICRMGINNEQNIEKLTREEAMTEATFLGLRMCEGIDLDKFKNQFDFDAKNIWQKKIDQLISEGYMKMNNNCIYLTDTGLFISDSIIKILLKYI